MTPVDLTGDDDATGGLAEIEERAAEARREIADRRRLEALKGAAPHGLVQTGAKR